nr:MoxR family ATPase [Ardenticatena sp.]
MPEHGVDVAPVQTFAERVIANVETVLVGKRDAIELLVVALLCEGHVLLEDVPGTGKTMLARALAASLGVSFRRIQCTPDLLPNDVIGVSVFKREQGVFEFRPGPIFVNVLLADELNRATPRTQAALLEAMQERQVTVDGTTYPLERPFLVLATQNPVEYEGTFPLPEAQLDRFFLRVRLGYLSLEDERRMLRRLRGEHPITHVQPVVQGSDVLALQPLVAAVHVDETVETYILNLVHATRAHPDLVLGASPRGSLALYKAAQAFAAIHGRDYVLPDDVKHLAPYVLEHRLIVRPESQLRGRTASHVVADVLERVEISLGENA